MYIQFYRSPHEPQSVKKREAAEGDGIGARVLSTQHCWPSEVGAQRKPAPFSFLSFFSFLIVVSSF